MVAVKINAQYTPLLHALNFPVKDAIYVCDTF